MFSTFNKTKISWGTSHSKLQFTHALSIFFFFLLWWVLRAMQKFSRVEIHQVKPFSPAVGPHSF